MFVLSKDGMRVAYASADSINMWNVLTKSNLLQIKIRIHYESASSLFLCWMESEGKLISRRDIATSPDLRLWDDQTGRLVSNLRGHSGYTTCASSFSHDGTILLVVLGSYDK